VLTYGREPGINIELMKERWKHQKWKLLSRVSEHILFGCARNNAIHSRHADFNMSPRTKE
jgi:hypothetical protein